MRVWGIKTKMVGKGLSMLARDTRKGVNTGLHLVGDELVKEFKKQVMAKNKYGRIYKIEGRLHRASKAYQTPANRTGHYRDMIGFYVSNLNLTFGNNAKYAAYLEDGTRNMHPRYGLKNTLKVLKEAKVEKLIDKSIKLAIK